MKRMNILLKCAFWGVIISLTILFSGCGYFNNASARQPTPTPTPAPTPDPSSQQQMQFIERKAEFVKLPAKVQLAKEPYLTGKLIAYERRTKFGEKPGEWRELTGFGSDMYKGTSEKFKNLFPRTPDDVKTIILSDCRQVKSGDYEIELAPGVSTNKVVPAYGWKCEVSFIDRTIPAVVYRKTFESEKTERTPVKNENVPKIEFYPPTSEIKKFVEDLPVR